MRYLPLLLLLVGCGGWTPWGGVDDNTYVKFEGADCVRWGPATVERQPFGRYIIRVKQDAPGNCDITFTEAVAFGLRERGPVWPPEEIRVTDAELWEPTQEAVQFLNEEGGQRQWVSPVRHVSD